MLSEVGEPQVLPRSRSIPTSATALRRTALSRPQPAKRPGREQRVDQAVDHVLERDTPRLPLPDRVLQLSDSIANERRRSRHAKNFQVLRARDAGAPGQVRDKNA